jgi:predicted transposase YbfD/YdcC
MEVMNLVRKSVKHHYSDLSAVETYKLVLDKKIKKFPNGFLIDNEIGIIEIVKYLIEEVLHWSDEDIKNNLTRDIFFENELRGILHYIFSGSIYSAINTAYPNRFKPWELNRVPVGYWNIETGILATKWLIEEKLHWSDEDIKNNLTKDAFKKNNLLGMLSIVFNGSPYLAINAVYPDKFKPWEVKIAPNKYWNTETGVLATKWLIEKVLHWSDEEVKNNLTMRIFCENKLGGMLCNAFNNSPYLAINATYPDRFKPWELRHTPLNYWNIETGILATKWLIEEKLHWSDEEIKKGLSKNIFNENGLSSMLQYVFNSSPFAAINAAYLGRFKKWEFKGCRIESEGYLKGLMEDVELLAKK